ncbi:SagB/ThcOx family dehydrogenase [Paludibacter jiangxiensis]|uniref:SagB-type dehydrogenase domain-containing protein n=1 Tax=Paludibacter jiangxiensis TaxID=681398 RepID=A0A161L7V3_9BACT|nr:SagB/ThcOx family dehydrogenase [Paludibacter jiangxiensis]GAT62924.1 SagB-type dehydrogenase domain-containing protein [Paludibacter jiangxiensis]
MKTLLLSAVFVCSCSLLSAQNIQLPQPVRTGGKPLMDALNLRQSARQFDSEKNISNQTLSNLLWAAWGFNREKKRTAPSSMDRQEIDLYVVTKEGIYKYDAAQSNLVLIVAGDYRKDTGMQSYVGEAPLNLVFVCNKSKINSKSESGLIEATYANSGFISQNIYLFCASEGLSTVVRASIVKEKLAKIMNLTDDQMITLAQTIGYPKK